MLCSAAPIVHKQVFVNKFSLQGKILRFQLSIEEEELGDNVADMIARSTDENLLQMPSSNATTACSTSEFTH